MKQSGKKIVLILGAVCIILLIIAPFALKETIDKNARSQDWIRTTAEITGFDFTVTAESEQTIISFSDEQGNEYVMPLGFFSADMYVGMKVPVAYDPKDISSIIYLGNNSFFINYGGVIMLIAGALLSGSAAVAIFIKLRHQKKIQG